MLRSVDSLANVIFARSHEQEWGCSTLLHPVWCQTYFATELSGESRTVTGYSGTL